MKKKLRLKPYVFPIIYMVLVLVLLGAVYYNGLISSSYTSSLVDDDFQYVLKINLDNTVSVVKTDEDVMVKPYNDESVSIGKSYYDYQSDSDSQIGSIIYYEGTYMQNSGVDYIADSEFSVVSCLSGTVLSVEKTDLMNYVVEIKYDNNIIISYQSLSSVLVSVNDTVSAGEEIGKSGKSTVSSDLGNHLHLEMYVDGVTVNPEDYYNTNIKDI